MNRNMPLSELITTLESLSDMMQSPMLSEAASRLGSTETALSILGDSLFYARMYKDLTPEGKHNRECLIEDADTIIRLIRKGGFEQ